MTEDKDRKIAVLIDGENAQYSLTGDMLAEVAKQGRVTIKRIYGDWSSRQMKGWKDQTNKYAVRAMHQFAFTRGKNSTDIALVIDAMDILHQGLADGFCLVSSDGDFTGLANRLREEGVFVMGIGQEKTPEAFVRSCELFIYTENLGDSDEEEEPIAEAEKPSRTPKAKAKPKKKVKPIPVNLLKKAFKNAVEENEMAYLGRMGEALRKIEPSFDPRTYGYPLLSKLIKSMTGHFEVVYPEGSDSAYVKLKRGGK
ncbi:MAG: NYN domain-containing protein [Salibacteraceae bacterium]